MMKLQASARSLVISAMFLGAIAALSSACAISGSSTDREVLYGSVDEMALDSDLVVIGTVIGSSEATDIENSDSVFTISDVSISEIVSAGSADRWDVGATVKVRQFGAVDSEEQIAPVELVQEGQTYLLFLTLSGLDGELGEQFYVTGSSAGLYEPAESIARLDGAALSTARFVQVEPNDSETGLREARPTDIG